MYITKFLETHQINDGATLLVNTLSGAIDRIENRFLPLLSGAQEISSHPELAEKLMKRGYVYPSRQEADAALVRLHKAYTSYTNPTMFVICPTYSCNLRCVYCFEGSLTEERNPRVMGPEEIDAIFKAIPNLAADQASIQLFGGEPFLPITIRAIDRIMSKAASAGLKVGAVTNGVHLGKFMPLLTKYRGCLTDFQITVDGTAAVHDPRRPLSGGGGTFSTIVKNIDMALRAGLQIRMRVNLDRQNITKIFQLADFVAAKGWPEFNNFAALLSPVDEHKGNELPNRLSEPESARQWLKLRSDHPQLSIFRADLFRNLEHIITTLKSNRASFPRFQYCESNSLGCYTFGTDGNVYLCAEAVGDNRTAVGSFFPKLDLNHSAIEQWNDRSILTLEKCRECSVATLCGGGCAYAALNINGSLDEPYCNNARETLHAYLDSIKEELVA